MNEQANLNKSILFNTVGIVLYFLCQWAFSWVCIRILGFETGGQFALAATLSNFFVFFATFYIRPFQVSDVAPKYSDGHYIALRLVTVVLSLLVFGALSLLYKSASSTIFLYIVFRAIESYVDVFHGMFQKIWRLNIVFWSLALRGIVSLIMLTIVLYFTANLNYGIISMILSSLIVSLLIDFNCAKKYATIKPDFEMRKIKVLAHESFSLLLYSIMTIAAGNIPRLYLEHYYGSELLGIYFSIFTPFSVISLGLIAIITPFTNLFASLYQQKKLKSLILLIVKSIAIIFALSIIAFIGTLFFGEFALKILYGEEVTQYSYLMMPIIVITILTAIQSLVNTLCIVMRDNKSLIFSSLLALFVSIALSNSLIKAGAMNGTNNVIIAEITTQTVIVMITIGYKMLIIHNKQKQFDK